jgi:hypothetical protein
MAWGRIGVIGRSIDSGAHLRSCFFTVFFVRNHFRRLSGESTASPTTTLHLSTAMATPRTDSSASDASVGSWHGGQKQAVAGPGPSSSQSRRHSAQQQQQAPRSRIRFPPDALPDKNKNGRNAGSSGRYTALGIGRPSVLRTFQDAYRQEDEDDRQRARSLDVVGPGALSDSSATPRRSTLTPADVHQHHKQQQAKRDRRRTTALAQAAAAASTAEQQGPVRTLTSDPDLCTSSTILPHPSLTIFHSQRG